VVVLEDCGDSWLRGYVESNSTAIIRFLADGVEPIVEVMETEESTPAPSEGVIAMDIRGDTWNKPQSAAACHDKLQVAKLNLVLSFFYSDRLTEHCPLVLTDGRVPETIAANFHFRISLAGLWNAGNGEIAESSGCKSPEQFQDMLIEEEIFFEEEVEEGVPEHVWSQSIALTDSEVERKFLQRYDYHGKGPLWSAMHPGWIGMTWRERLLVAGRAGAPSGCTKKAQPAPVVVARLLDVVLRGVADNEVGTHVALTYFAEALQIQGDATLDNVRTAVQKQKQECLVAAAAAWDLQHPGILNTIKLGAEEFFAWADKDGNGHISFEEARAVLQFLEGRKTKEGFDIVDDLDYDLQMWDSFVGAGDTCNAGCDPTLGPNRQQFMIGLQWVLDNYWERRYGNVRTDDQSKMFNLAWSHILEHLGIDPECPVCPQGILDTIKPGAEAMFAWADRNGDGRISFDEAFALIDTVSEELVTEYASRKLFRTGTRRDLWDEILGKLGLPTDQGLDRAHCKTLLHFAIGTFPPGSPNEQAFNAIWAHISEETRGALPAVVKVHESVPLEPTVAQSI
jgi:hypothetical protein